MQLLLGNLAVEDFVLKGNLEQLQTLETENVLQVVD